MFAVIKTGGKQYRVQEGDVLQVEKLGALEGQEVYFDQVLLIDDGGKTLIGMPFVENAQVRAEVLENFKDTKILVFKKKRRKQYKKERGHRQELTRLRIDQIIPDLRAIPEKEVAKIEKKVEKRVAPKEKPMPKKLELETGKKERRVKEKKVRKREPEEKRGPSKKQPLVKLRGKPKKPKKAKE